MCIRDRSETIGAATITSNIIAVSYADSAVFYAGGTPSALMTMNVTNLPSVTDTTRVYTMNIIYPTTAGNYYINSVGVNGAAAATPKFPSAPSATGTNTLVSQQFIFVYQNSTFRILSSVINYST